MRDGDRFRSQIDGNLNSALPSDNRAHPAIGGGRLAVGNAPQANHFVATRAGQRLAVGETKRVEFSPLPLMVMDRRFVVLKAPTI